MKPTLPSNLPKKGLALLRSFSRLKLMVAGDLVADEAVYGVTERISREAPVLILRYSHTVTAPGGAANAACNARDLGAKVYLLGVVGRDEGGKRLLETFRQKGLDLDGVLEVPGRHTTVKSRILAGAQHTAKQQVIRIDRYDDKDIPRSAEAKLLGRITSLAPKADALLISDYQLGVLTPRVRRALLSAFQGKPIVVDSRFNLPEYRGATLVTPNVAEAGPAAGVEVVDETSLAAAGRSLRKQLDCEVLITRGPHGMALFYGDDCVKYLPVQGIDQPVDPTGAGDTVAATVTLSLAAGADLVTAASLATVAAGLVVAKRGTVTAPKEEVEEALKGMQRHG